VGFPWGCVVNESLVRTLGPEEEAVGQHLVEGSRVYEVIGVSPGTANTAPWGSRQDPISTAPWIRSKEGAAFASSPCASAARRPPPWRWSGRPFISTALT
jgi:hypothetical protein